MVEANPCVWQSSSRGNLWYDLGVCCFLIARCAVFDDYALYITARITDFRLYGRTFNDAEAFASDDCLRRYGFGQDDPTPQTCGNGPSERQGFDWDYPASPSCGDCDGAAVGRRGGFALGAMVGYQHRFESKLSPSTRFKFMTDGILLAETRHDPLFKKYSTLMIDEAHERSLNIDFLLGLLKRILPRRPDLHVIISSATLDAERFSTFFDNAPVITIPGRLFPIETQWLNDEAIEEDDLPRLVANAVDSVGPDSGDILVFLPGVRDSRYAP